jgi:hypothetical protein
VRAVRSVRSRRDGSAAASPGAGVRRPAGASHRVTAARRCRTTPRVGWGAGPVASRVRALGRCDGRRHHGCRHHGCRHHGGRPRAAQAGRAKRGRRAKRAGWWPRPGPVRCGCGGQCALRGAPTCSGRPSSVDQPAGRRSPGTPRRHGAETSGAVRDRARSGRDGSRRASLRRRRRGSTGRRHGAVSTRSRMP